jgi:hypothetical protein
MSCRTVAEKKWIQSNLLLECSSENLKKSFAIALPILIIQIGVPLIILSIIYKKFKKGDFKSKESISSFTKNYGYFFLDYSDKCYYWEFVRIFQKVLIICFLIIFRDNSILKGMFTLAFILLYGFLTYR